MPARLRRQRAPQCASIRTGVPLSHRAIHDERSERGRGGDHGVADYGIGNEARDPARGTATEEA